MESLRTFFMEEILEEGRFLRFNMGESGFRSLSIKELLSLLDIPKDDVLEEFLGLSLRDSPNWGRADLREEVAKIHPGAQKANVLMTTGTSEALMLLLRRMNAKKVAFIAPAFQLLYEIPESLGASLLPLPLRWNEAIPHAPLDEWLHILEKERPDCLILNHPHNPSGLTFSQEQLSSLKNKALSIGAIVIADEHYRFLCEDGELGPTLFENHPRVFVTGSFTKCFGTPGLRIGWCVGNKETLSLMQNEKNYFTHTVNPVSEWLAFHILSKLHTSSLFSTIQKEWQENKRTLENFLRDSKHFLGAFPQGGLVCSIAFSNPHQKIAPFYEHALKNNVFVLPLTTMEFSRFKIGDSPLEKGEGFRLGLGIHPQAFKEALNSLESWLTERPI